MIVIGISGRGVGDVHAGTSVSNCARTSTSIVSHRYAQIGRKKSQGVVVGVRGRAEIMAPDLAPGTTDPSHPHLTRLTSHFTNDKLYSYDDVMDLTTSCF